MQGAFAFDSGSTSAALTVFEDNQGTIALANVPKMTPWSKHIAIPYHFFREFIRKKEVEVKHVSTEKQMADMLTKGLEKDKFEKLRKELLGW